MVWGIRRRGKALGVRHSEPVLRPAVAGDATLREQLDDL
jgi:hypothetical protein